MCKYCEVEAPKLTQGEWVNVTGDKRCFIPDNEDDLNDSLYLDENVGEVEILPINNDKQTPALTIWAFHGEETTTFPAIPIYFCPICGRKLVEVLPSELEE